LLIVDGGLLIVLVPDWLAYAGMMEQQTQRWLSTQMVERELVSENEMVLAILQAELDSPRPWGDCVKAGLAALGLERSLIDAPDLTDSRQNAQRKRLLGYRGYECREGLFAGFPLHVIWRRVDLEACDFQAMRYINDSVTAAPNWNEFSSRTRLVSVGARNFPAYSSDERFGHIAKIAEAIRCGKRFQPLIAAQHYEGHLVLIEGHSRATAYVMEGFIKSDAIVGSSPSMANWAFY
jgi:hypothetical protein